MAFEIDVPDMTVVVLTDNEPRVNVIDDASVQVNLTEPATSAVVSGSYISFAETSLSASYAATASYVVAGGDTFPYTGDAEIYGTLSVSDEISTPQINTNTIVLSTGNLNLVLTGSITSGVFGVSENIQPSISSLQYSGGVIEYIATRSTGTRIGIIMATWIGETKVFSDVSSADIGDTSDISFDFIRVGTEWRLRIHSQGSGSGEWTVQTLFRLFPRL